MPETFLPAYRPPPDDHRRRGPRGLLDGMREATRLTRAGDLAQATALIQHSLGQQRTEAPQDSPGPAPRPPEPSRMRTRRPARPSTPPIVSPDWTGRGSSPTVATEPSPGRFVAAAFGNRAGTRGYKLYLPDGADRGARPLLVMLHGCTQDADDFAAGTRMNALAHANGFFVVYPEQSCNANPSRCWNWFEAADQRRDSGEPSIIADITREVAAAHRVDGRRIYVAGLSAGAAMAVIMSATYPDLYAAAGVHSGLAYGAASDLPSALQAMKRGGGRTRAPGPDVFTPTIVFHGDQDLTVNRRNGDEILSPWLAAGSQRVGGERPPITVRKEQVPGGRHSTRSVYSGIDGRLLAESWTVHGLGHAWSGGDPSGSFTDPRGPDASAEMVRFFHDVTAQRSSL